MEPTICQLLTWLRLLVKNLKICVVQAIRFVQITPARGTNIY